MNTYTAELRKALLGDPLFRESLDIVLNVANRDRKIFVVGGTVYRTLIRIIYGINIDQKADHDFIVETVPHELHIIPKGWQLGKTAHGQHRFNNKTIPDRQIDIVRLADAINHWDSSEVDQNDPMACIRSYLDKTPLNIQSIAYDIQENIILGAASWQAIVERTVRVHHRLECASYCQVKGITAQEYAKRKADSIAFQVDID